MLVVVDQRVVVVVVVAVVVPEVHLQLVPPEHCAATMRIVRTVPFATALPLSGGSETTAEEIRE